MKKLVVKVLNKLRKIFSFSLRKVEEKKEFLEKEVFLDDYCDSQIAALLDACVKYKKAKRDPDAFVEQYFAAFMAPHPGLHDSWRKDLSRCKTCEEPPKYPKPLCLDIPFYIESEPQEGFDDEQATQL